ncbi:MAG: hypothetical protein A3H98_12025 [Bacteroidetes bacterium RIFCSPLOWO2_02_FULL_36_8]|nr:MAG: hypothetical protein A3H98_12025 [Bacteroidetes bacterium RIFCSPLOWO2_02_FULL_36_8]OFY69558.1 MAG: hypothetical protein A3G23_11005 [Bacteroidetes bacterium RIFCSPLOWO2_12_FULL_37_12]
MVPPLTDVLILPSVFPQVGFVPVKRMLIGEAFKIKTLPEIVQLLESVIVTVYVPADKLLMFWGVAPLDHAYE